MPLERGNVEMTWEGNMTTALYRGFCPDTTDLGEYHLGLLVGDRRIAIVQHLATCPHCQREMAQLDQFLTSVAPDIEFSVVDRIKVWVARLVPQGFNTSMGLAPALAVRGAGTGPRLYEAGDAQVGIDVQADGQPGTYTLVGLVMGVDLDGMQAILTRGDEVAAALDVDDLGNFIFDDLRAGTYALTLSGPDLEIEVPDVEVS